MSLAGKTILITRAPHQSGELADAIRRLGGTPFLFPTILISSPASWEECDRAIRSLYMYDGLLFTSANAVESFFDRLGKNSESAKTLAGKMICVVGEKTKQSVERRGLTVAAMPEKFTARDLAATLRREDLKGKTFLFPRGNLGGDTLPAALKGFGASVDEAVVYQTMPPKTEEVDTLRSSLLAKQIDVLTFTSPSSFRNFLALVPREELDSIRSSVTIAVIGSVTAGAVRDAGLEADVVARESTVASLAESVSEYFAATASRRNSQAHA
jgi:uroporphyrinogen-III synthase